MRLARLRTSPLNLAFIQSSKSSLERDLKVTIYSKTNLGRLRAFEQKSSVSSDLRGLLRRIDGKTSIEALISQPEDAELFEELLRRQLVEVVTDSWRNSTPPTHSLGQQSTDDVADEPLLSLVSKLDSPRVDSKIEAIKILMVGFIQLHLPEHADTTLDEINALNSEAQLLSMLNGYINLINAVGRAGQEHVQNLLLILAHTE